MKNSPVIKERLLNGKPPTWYSPIWPIRSWYWLVIRSIPAPNSAYHYQGSCTSQSRRIWFPSEKDTVHHDLWYIYFSPSRYFLSKQALFPPLGLLTMKHPHTLLVNLHLFCTFTSSSITSSVTFADGNFINFSVALEQFNPHLYIFVSCSSHSRCSI